MSSCWTLRSKVISTLLVALLAVSVFCSSDKKTNVNDDDGVHPSRSSPGGVLEFLINYYEAEDASGYADALCDGYLFQFTMVIAESLGLPEDEPWWGKTEDVMSTANMFADTCVVSIKMEYEYVTDWYPCVDERPDTTYSGLCCRIEPDIRITLRRPGEDWLMLWVNASYLDIMVVRDRFAEDLWCILGIAEYAKAPLEPARVLRASAVEGISWGAIKAEWKAEGGMR